jgi:hypothetical protein
VTLCKTTKAQRKAIHTLWLRTPNVLSRDPISYRRFRKTVQRACAVDCLMVQWCGMWIGIETDGYTHS